MKIRILGSAPPGGDGHQYLTSYLVDRGIAVDAGCLGLHSLSPDVERVRHVFITHAHVDHVGTLPIFLETALDPGEEPARVYGSSATLDAICHHLFNGQLWVEAGMLTREDFPMIRLHALAPETTVEVNGLLITGVPVDHPVSTLGYVLDDGDTVVAIGADSGPTERLWQVAGATGRMRAVFLECSFPNALGALACRTGHLTPRLWVEELKKLPSGVMAVAVHIKPRYRERVVAELMALDHEAVHIGVPDRDYSW